MKSTGVFPDVGGMQCLVYKGHLGKLTTVAKGDGGRSLIPDGQAGGDLAAYWFWWPFFPKELHYKLTI